MKSAGKMKSFSKTMLSGAISTALSVGLGLGVTTVAQADTYAFSYTGLFTMLDPSGKGLQNTSYPFYGDATWGYGFRSQISGTLNFDTATGAGSGTVQPFNFFSKGPAVASGVVFQSLATPADPTNPLMLGNMSFAWNSNLITTQIVLDGSGLFAAIGSGAASSVGAVFDQAFCGVVAGSPCPLPGSDGFKKGNYPIGPIPIATSTFNTAGQTATTTTLGQLSLGTDDGIGGSPMDNGPFSGFNANFDMLSVTVTSFTDTTPPAITLNGSNPLILALNSPAYTDAGATCQDGAPLNTNLDANIVVNGVASVDTATGGVYSVTYDCSDSSNNAAPQAVRTVVIASPGAPTVVLNGSNPVSHECATSYVDAGAVCADFEDGVIPVGGNFVKDQTIIDANTGTVGTYNNSVTWTCQDISVPVSSPVVVARTVDVVDTIAPQITINPALEGGTTSVNLVSTTADNPVTYVDQGASVVDTCDQASIGITTTNPVSVTVPDTGNETLVYTVKYEAKDASLNLATKTRTVNVTRSQPVISLQGSAAVVLSVGQPYVESGMDVADAQDGPLTGVTTSTPACLGGISNCVIDPSSVDTNTKGTYTVTYDVTDSNGNKATQVSRTVTVGAFAEGSNFSMMDPSGNVFGGTNDVVFDWDGVTINTDETDTNFGVMTIASAKPQPFFTFLWTAHHVRVFGPGTYSFDSTCTAAQYDAGITDCGGNKPMTMTVPPGHFGGHILFDWGKPTASSPCGVKSCDIDVVNVWEVGGVWDRHGDTGARNQLFDGQSGLPPDPTTTWKLVSTDVNGDGVNASPMVDGPFQGFYANFNAGPGGTSGPKEPVQITQPDTKLGSGVLASVNVFAIFTGLMVLFGLRRFTNKR